MWELLFTILAGMAVVGGIFGLWMLRWAWVAHQDRVHHHHLHHHHH